MRNHADELLFIETAKAGQPIERTQVGTSNRHCSRPGNSTPAGRPVLRARWVLVDETLKLVWSEDHEEPLRRVA
jgi:hypothetical protein